MIFREGASLKMSQVSDTAGDSVYASVFLTKWQLFKKYRGESAKPPPGLDKDRDWNVDLIPKFLMAGGELAAILRQLKQVDTESVNDYAWGGYWL